MAQNAQIGGACCAPVMIGVRTLTFPDGLKCSVSGLDETMITLYAEGREVNEETGREIVLRLERKNNYIPSSDEARKEYVEVLLKEYERFVTSRKSNNR